MAYEAIYTDGRLLRINAEDPSIAYRIAEAHALRHQFTVVTIQTIRYVRSSLADR